MKEKGPILWTLLFTESTSVQSGYQPCKRQSAELSEKSLTICLVFYVHQLEFPCPQLFLP